MHENLSKSKDEGKRKSPPCFGYKFSPGNVSFRKHEEAVASVLPCFWIYREVGDYILNNAGPDNPYREWIDTYAAEEFRKATDTAIEITDEIAAKANELTRSKMTEVFKTSARLEYIFWESAYKKENWIV
jgi:thiaminase/transcriptional activator TenA